MNLKFPWVKWRKKPERRLVILALPPDVPFAEGPFAGATHVCICSACGATRYTDGRLSQALELAKSHDPEGMAWPRHKPCDAIMELVELGQDAGPAPGGEEESNV